MIRDTASDTSGNIFRRPVWNRSGSSPQHEEMVEGEAGRRRDVRHEDGDPIDAVGDFADVGSHDFLHAIILVVATGRTGRRWTAVTFERTITVQ